MKIALEEVKELPVYKSLIETGKFEKEVLAKELHKALQVAKNIKLKKSSVLYCFDWYGTPQGEDYWSRVDDIQENCPNTVENL